MSACGELTLGFALDCDNPLIAGAKDRLILINKNDIDVVTYDMTDGEVITDITLKAGGKQGYAWEGQNRSLEPEAVMVKGRYSNNFDHITRFLVFGDGNAVKEQLNKMINGRFVAIVESNYQGAAGEAAFHVFGIKGGLEAAELQRLWNDAETEGAYSVVLQSSEFGREPRLPNSWFDTDYATTAAAVEALLTPTV